MSLSRSSLLSCTPGNVSEGSLSSSLRFLRLPPADFYEPDTCFALPLSFSLSLTLCCRCLLLFSVRLVQSRLIHSDSLPLRLVVSRLAYPISCTSGTTHLIAGHLIVAYCVLYILFINFLAERQRSSARCAIRGASATWTACWTRCRLWSAIAITIR